MEKITSIEAVSNPSGIRIEHQKKSERRFTVNDVLKVIGLVGLILIVIAVLVMGTKSGNFSGAVMGVIIILSISGIGALIASGF